MARSRAQAASLIASGRVEVRGLKATKAATGVDGDTPVRVVEGTAREYVSRGGYKLAGALAALPGIEVAGRRCLDAGASTGGFTDVLLRRGAAEVVAVDVGYGQLAWSLRSDPRVRVVDRTNVRSLTPDQIGGRVGLTVVDVSFISLGVIRRCELAPSSLSPSVLPSWAGAPRALHAVRYQVRPGTWNSSCGCAGMCCEVIARWIGPRSSAKCTVKSTPPGREISGRTETPR